MADGGSFKYIRRYGNGLDLDNLAGLETQNLFVDSTISKDRTEGRKQDDEEALKSLPKKDSATRGRPRSLSPEVITIDVPPNHRRARSWTDSTRSSIAEPVYSEVGKPPSIQRSRSPIPWRQDLELRHSSMPQADEQTDRGVKDDCSVSESAVFKGLSKGKDEMKNDSLHEAMEEKVRL
jgi:hypothetical protein